MENAENEEVKLDRKDLKIQALMERIAQLTAEYENKVAELRIEVTYLSAELEEYKKEEETEES